ncbi:MAG: formate/nitrite transporter family protein [Alphaproteobacteria bacterium]
MTEPPTSSGSGIDAYAPAEIAARVDAACVAKIRLRPVQTATLGVLAGAFIAFGAMAYTLVVTDSALGFGPTRLVGGLAFAVGLILVIVGGGELFTGNNLLVMGWADGCITTRALLANWLIVYVANFAGAIATAILAWLAGMYALDGGAVGATAIGIAAAKVELGFADAFFRGLLCNVLVCLAVWLCFAARDVTGKVLAILFPVATFVALGFEHSVANMYAIPAGWLAAHEPAVAGAGAAQAHIGLAGFAANLVPVTLGNIVGGGGFVAFVYYLVYRRTAKPR